MNHVSLNPPASASGFGIQVRPKASVDIFLLVVLIVLTVMIPFIYLAHERFIYFWDYANYHNQVSELASVFRESKGEAVRLFITSFNTDYNKLFALLLLPFLLTFGDSRLVFIIALGLVYILPFSLLMGAIATKIIPFQPRAVFWSTVFTIYAIPNTWIPALRGYPDLGAASLVALALLIFLQDTKLSLWWQIPGVSLPLALAIVFRRHYAYNVIAFFCTIAMLGLILFLGRLRYSPREAIREITRFGLRAGSLALMVLVISSPILYLILQNNYSQLYSSYEEPIPALLRYYGGEFGWSGWLFLVTGFSVGGLNPKYRRASIIFIALFGSLALAIWTLFPKQTGTPFSTHFLFLIALGQALFFWTVFHNLKGLRRFFPLAILVLFLVGNFLFRLTPLGAFNHPLRSWFASPQLPLVRKDYAEFARLIHYLRAINQRGKTIYVVASSDVLNQDLVREAESQLFGRENVELSVFPSPDIDSRDTYPLEGLLKADVVIVANPFQSMLRPEEQEVVEVAFETFTENWVFARDFELLPMQFILGDGVIVRFYQRLRPTFVETALLTLRLFQDQVQPRPGNQSDWLLLEASGTGWIGKNPDQSVNLGFDRNGTASYLYFGTLPDQIFMKARMRAPGDQGDSCGALSLRLVSLTQQGSEVNHAETLISGQEPSEFSLSLDRENAAYLRLDLNGQENVHTEISCTTQILGLKISGP